MGENKDKNDNRFWGGVLIVLGIVLVCCGILPGAVAIVPGIMMLDGSL